MMIPSTDVLPLPGVLVDKTLTTFYLEERSTLALDDGTIITCDIAALRLKDIREYIRTRRELHNGLYFGKNLVVKQVDSTVIDDYLARSTLAEQHTHTETDNHSDVAHRFKKLQQKAVNLGSSDIHIEWYEHETQFYARVDGRRVLLENSNIAEIGEKLGSYLFNAKATMKDTPNFVATTPNNGLVEERLECPTDIDGETEPRLTQWRAAYVNCKGGGKLTLRWLNASKTVPALDKMGLHPGHITMLKSFCFGNSGLCMIGGKTGSGKTTLIAALLMLFGKDKAVGTVEDPPEFNLGIPQIHATPNQRINDEVEARGFNYYSKALLRHDLDVELHGEVRDHKGAMEVTRKGETGQIMFTTLHTSSAMGIGHTLTEQLHVPPAVVAAPDLMRIWAYQTLVRTLCPHCKMSHDVARDDYADKGDADTFNALFAGAIKALGDAAHRAQYRRPEGCKHCIGGEKGRTALIEIIMLDNEDRAFIVKKDYLGWQASLLDKGFKTVRDHAISKIKAGLIDIETASQKVTGLIPGRASDFYALLDVNEGEAIDNEDKAEKTLDDAMLSRLTILGTSPHVSPQEDACHLDAP
jgi:type II secretory ATPase GspE/PulE/Tfp pilus assembly ATPase PilB-like protein